MFFWQFPQNLIGALILLIYRKKIRDTREREYATIYLMDGPCFGVSLGRFIFLPGFATYRSHSHEYGHTLQSRMLGPLYLIIVGLPSITMNVMSRMNKKFAMNYYKRWPENWADKLGGVNR